MHIGSGQHFAGELLEKYAMGKLEERQIPVLEEHLLVCEECQVQLADIDDYVTAARGAARELELKKAARKPRLMELLSGNFWAIPKPVWAVGIAAALLVSTVIPLTHHSATETEVYLSSLRGSETVASAHGKFVLRIDAATLTGLPAYRLQLVDSSGGQVWESRVIPRNGQIVAQVPHELNAGRYWVRLYRETDSAQPLQELALHVD